MAIYFHTFIIESNETPSHVYQTPQSARLALIECLSLGVTNPDTEILEIADLAIAKPGHWVRNTNYGDVMIYPVKLEG